MADNLIIAEEKLNWELSPYLTTILARFYNDKSRWSAAINIIAELDCLCSLAKLASKSAITMTRPEFETQDPSYLDIKGLVHPVLATRNPFFISNDVKFTREKPFYVVTGPNMGGKSTVLRQVGIAVILAQMGSFVPCEYIKLYPVDFIFTRLGASDSLAEGKSTFFLETEEASKVLHKGTKSSLVIMDELGRGTSTDDGSSIALGFLDFLTHNIKPRMLFTTHYHMIISDISELPGVVLVYMDSVIDEITQKILFLYKLREGICPRSYGLNVARLAGISGQKLEIAQQISEEIEQKYKEIKIMGEIRKFKLQGLGLQEIKYKLQQLNLI